MNRFEMTEVALEQELAMRLPEQPLPIGANAFANLCNPELPIQPYASDIAEAMTTNQLVVIISPPGTGKSTQLPKIALGAGFDMIHQTQPRRPAAVNVGMRILSEVGAVLGEEKASELVSIQTGAGRIGPRDARIQVKTEGILLRQEGFDSQRTFQPRPKGSLAWILDEVHEQGEKLERLMGKAKERTADPNFTAVYMSATPDKDGLIRYLTDTNGREPAVIELTAPMYPVEERERPKSDLMKEIMRAARDIYENPDTYGGSNTIQVFESGVGEINEIIDQLYEKLSPHIKAVATILPNHAKLSRKQQELVAQDVEGVKIVVQTNIGKTSTTIPRTRYVITVGKERQMWLDEEGMPKLTEVPVSKADMGQQKGRTGRNNPGIFVVTQRDGEQFIPWDSRPEHAAPEVQRIQLDDPALALAFEGESIRDFDYPKTPDAQNIERAISRLQAIGALDDKEKITETGRKMFTFAASPEGQRSMVESLQYPLQIRQYMAAMIAMREMGGLHTFMPEKSDEESGPGTETSSDMLACLDAFIEARTKSYSEMIKEQVSVDAFVRTEELYVKLTKSAGVTELIGLKPPTEPEREILRSCILAGHVNDIFMPVGKNMFQRIGGSGPLRKISMHSVVPQFTHRPIVGTAQTLEVYEKGKKVELPIIHTATRTTIQEVGRVAAKLTPWKLTQLRLRGDSFIAVEEKYLGSHSVDMRERPAESGPRLRAAVIEAAKNNPGKHLLYLYGIKSDTEALAHKSKTTVTRLTQNTIDALIEEIAPESITNPSHVDELLRQYIVERGLSLDTYVSASERARIDRDAPARIDVSGQVFRVTYRQGRPLVYVRNDIESFANLPDQVCLRDGRNVLFVYDDARLTSQQLKKRLIDIGLL